MVTDEPQVYTLEAWRDEVTRQGGGDMGDCRFRCPLCGHAASPRDFEAAGADPDRAARNCIGRVTGANGGLFVTTTPMPQPCDWTAGGLFTNLGKGLVVKMPDGRLVDVFPFAEPIPTSEVVP